MYCPNCGKKTATDQKFCRACGLGLEKIALSLAEQLPTKIDESLQARKDRLERLGVAALSVFGLGILTFILYNVGYKLMMTQGKFLAGLALLGLIIVVGCGMLATILFARANELGEAATKRQLQQTNGSTGNESTKELLPEGRLEPLPSVTERTTELLFVDKGDAKSS